MNLTATIYTEDDRPISVFGTWSPAEPGVGLFEPSVEIEGAEFEGRAVDLTNEQRGRAEEALWSERERRKEKHKADLEDAMDARREDAAEMLREARR